MSFAAGKNTVVLFDASNLSAYFKDAKVSSDVGMSDVTVFGASAKAFLPTIRDGKVSLGGFWDGGVTAADAILRAAFAAASGNVFSITPGQDTTIGNRAWMLSARQTSYEISAPVGDVVSIASSIQVDGGIDAGFSHHALGTETGTGNYASIDGAAATTNGGVGHLHVTGATNLTAATFKIQDSANNSAWADILTFTDVTAAGAQRVAITGTVRRYVRAIMSALTGDDITFVITFARR
jgi:hypothetical protein